MPRASHQPSAHRVRPFALAQFRNRGGEARIAPVQHVRQHPPTQQVSLPILDRTRSRYHPGFDGKRRQQILGESVDRIDPQAAAGRIEHTREQGPRPSANVGRRLRPEPRQLLAKFRVVHANPSRQNAVDPHRHLRGACLRESQAQDRRGTDAVLQQQAQHARGQHLRLASAGAGGKPHAFSRIDRVALCVGQRVDLTAHAPSSSSMRGNHSARRINWSKVS